MGCELAIVIVVPEGPGAHDGPDKNDNSHHEAGRDVEELDARKDDLGASALGAAVAPTPTEVPPPLVNVQVDVRQDAAAGSEKMEHPPARHA